MLTYGPVPYATAQTNAAALQAGGHVAGVLQVARPTGVHASRPCVSLSTGARLTGDGAEVSQIVSHPECTGQTRVLGVGLADSDARPVHVEIDDIGIRNDVPDPGKGSHALFFYGPVSAGITALLRNVVVFGCAGGDGVYLGSRSTADLQNVRVVSAFRNAVALTGNGSRPWLKVSGCDLGGHLVVELEGTGPPVATGVEIGHTRIGGGLVVGRSVGLRVRGVTVLGTLRLLDPTDAELEDVSADFRWTGGELKGLDLRGLVDGLRLRRIALRVFGAPGLYAPKTAKGVTLQQVEITVDPGPYAGNPAAPSGAAIWAPGGAATWTNDGDVYTHVRGAP